MFQEDANRWAEAAKDKVNLLHSHPGGYFIASMLAGLFVGFAICLVFTIQTLIPGASTKVLMGFCFSIALTLVVIAGAELFTGNNMVMTLGLARKTVTLPDTLKLWAVCWIGNLLGSIICGALFVGGGFTAGDAAEVFTKAALAKAELAFLPLVFRGILCNILVCLAVWGSGRIADGGGKILYITLCLATFVIIGFEHSVANMTLFSIGLMAKSAVPLAFSGVVHNLIAVTLGNMIGGICFVGIPYALIARE
ncbi:formate/nitrite transporter family protein [Aedoeadaptatus coxii]|uniref:formate/nitrite transporter family protein n=1 Tax=Aedoeadaptatus coxii TaxID=755172 RepID=UPI002AD1E2FE|nr:formate/nitrite transporter family protein [Peptoniphilus coxii]